MPTKLIIFDNDGVLIDSDIIWHQCCATEMTRLGFPMTVKDSIRIFSGLNHDETFEKIIEREYGLSDIEVDFAKIAHDTEASYSSLLNPVKDIHMVLEFLEKANIKKCIASNGDFEYIETTMHITGLKKYFSEDSMFGVEGDLRRKPEPDVFLQAAKKYSVDPADCLVIEDHALGIKAAKAANMKVIGFLGATTHSNSIKHRDWIARAMPNLIVEDASQLLRFLQDLT